MIKVGKVSYLNTLPLFYSWDTQEVSLIEGHPSELVKKLRAGQIQAGIVSSVEFLLHPEDYRVVPGISISSRERACSVLIFSKRPLEFIRSIHLTPASMTSKMLAMYVLKRVYGNSPEVVERSQAEALLLIGDEAFSEKDSGRWDYIYDLGEEWFRLHGLPFVFALFLVRRDAPEWLDQLILEQCRKSREEFYHDLEEGKLRLQKPLKDYFNLCLDYTLDEEGWRSLSLFKEILMEDAILCKNKEVIV